MLSSVPKRCSVRCPQRIRLGRGDLAFSAEDSGHYSIFFAEQGKLSASPARIVHLLFMLSSEPVRRAIVEDKRLRR
jgi:hypothetical protein